MDHESDPANLVREVWRNQVRLLGERLFEMAAANPSKALAAAGSGGADEALRFDMKLALETIVAALNVAKLGIDTWKSWKTAKRATVASELDALIRSKVKGRRAEEALLNSKQYADLLAKIAKS